MGYLLSNLLKSRIYLLLLISCYLLSCKEDKKKPINDAEITSSNSLTSREKENEVFKISTQSMEFKIPRDTLYSGWNTFVYENNSNETHFIAVEKYPDGKRLEDGKKEVVPPFQHGMDFIEEGKIDEAMAEFGKLPEWSTKIIYYGGVGFTSPKTTSQSTIYLDPGVYIMECYVKMPNGQFHVSMGMEVEIIVKNEASSVTEPKADYVATISGENGITFNDKVVAGNRTFQIKFEDQKVHEHFLGHDVNLVRMEPGSNINALADWMNWMNPKGLITPAPTGFKFIGGLQDVPAGKSGYFTAELRKGNYILIAEVPKPLEKNMLVQFEIE